jgi:hypothetical protein
MPLEHLMQNDPIEKSAQPKSKENARPDGEGSVGRGSLRILDDWSA